MVRAFALFLIIFGFFAILVFGYKEISKQDIKVAGKLIFAAVLAAILSTVIYLGEVG